MPKINLETPESPKLLLDKFNIYKLALFQIELENKFIDLCVN